MTHTTREILSAFQYLLIGLVALGVVLRWYGSALPYWQVMIWLVIAGGLSIGRIIILVFSEWFRDSRWQTIRRRNWD